MAAFLTSVDREYLESKGYNYEQHEDGGKKGLIVKAMPLPPGKFDASAADVLIVLPTGYPDAAPDMFYMSPWLRLTSSGTYPKCADQPYSFLGITWQRWSRHNAEWRAGIDGLHTMMARISEALQAAVK